ncbi:MAG TPA: glycosyltransferase [Candidatus Hydrogenedentes bacterium]|nr:glycosyltransferase [Candidatus Hydrogenedentota bacterium]HOS01542.1 glycosyltransferase [Candidatus Hydrogenedentota bacterium]
MPELVSIIIPAHNQLDYCRACVDSVLRHTRPPFRLVLIDNGSTDGVAEYFDSTPDAMVVHTGRNLGFPAGVNRGLAHAQGHVLLLNSDTVVTEGWLERLEEALLETDDIGMAGPVSNCVSGFQQIETPPLRDEASIHAFSKQRALDFHGQRRETDRLVGFCLLIRDAAFVTVGLLDEAYGIGNFEDDDYGLRVRLAGFRMRIADDCFIYHYGGRSFAGLGIAGDRFHALMDTNERYFLQKWRKAPLELLTPYFRSRLLSLRAHEALEHSQMEECLQCLKGAIEAAPLLGQNYNDLGAVLWQIEQYDKAFECFVHAVKLEPGNAAAKANLADAANALGRTSDLHDLLRSARGQ